VFAGRKDAASILPADRAMAAMKPHSEPSGDESGDSPALLQTVDASDPRTGETLAFDAAPAPSTVAATGHEPRALVDRALMAEPGDFIARYRICRVLGRGGMGAVYLAHDMQLDRQVALKIPKLDDDASPRAAQRFYREARAAAALNHPHICPIFDIGEDAGRPYIAMAYIEGRPLTAYIGPTRRQNERQAAMVIRKVALALHEAHSQGIIHRDLKPANIMINRRGEPVVMDFGLARDLNDESHTQLTQEGALVGTPAYMAPEQIDHRAPIGPASDVYSLGIALYELLTGQRPFNGSVVSVIGQILHKAPKQVQEHRPDVSPALADICHRAMAKNPADRFPSMKELARALTAFLKGDPGVDTVSALAPVFFVEPPPLEPPPLEPLAESACLAPPIADTTLTAIIPPQPAKFPAKSSFPAKRWPTLWLAGAATCFLATAAMAGLAIVDGMDQGQAEGPLTTPETTPWVFTKQQLADRGAAVRLLQKRFQQADRNQSGKLELEEIPARLITRADVSGDRALEFYELRCAFEERGAALFKP
jgi:serine/threonine protein kinase